MKCIFNLCDFKREEEYCGPYPPKNWEFAIPTPFSVMLSEVTFTKPTPRIRFRLEVYSPQQQEAYYRWEPKT